MTDNNTGNDQRQMYHYGALSGTSTINQSLISNAWETDQKKLLPINLASLDGSASYDPDGTIATYAWSQISGPSTAGISSAATAKTNVTGLIQGTYQFQLAVTDNKGSTATSIVSVQVLAALPVNQAPVADAGSNITIKLPTNSTTLDAEPSLLIQTVPLLPMHGQWSVDLQQQPSTIRAPLNQPLRVWCRDNIFFN